MCEYTNDLFSKRFKKCIQPEISNCAFEAHLGLESWETVIVYCVSILHFIPYIVLACFAYFLFFPPLSFYVSCIDDLAASLNLLQR